MSAFLLSAVAVLYGQFLWNPIVFDDLPFFMVDGAGHQPADDFRYSPFELRSLPYATLAWGKAAFGLEVLHFRVENLLLHAAVVLVLFSLLTRLFMEIYGGKSNKDSLSPLLAAFFAALLFALHPVAVYAAGYLVQRSIVMATLFSLLAMLVYVHGSMRGKPLLLWMSVPLYYLAVFSKEHAIMLPFVLLTLTVLLHDDWWIRLKQRWGVFAALASIALFVLLASRGFLGSVYEPNATEMLQQEGVELAYPLSVITQSWMFFKYALLWLFPNPAWMSVDMREPFARSLLSPYLFSVGCFVIWGVGGVWLLLKRGRAGLAGFALLFPWLMFFPEFSSVRIQEPFVLYRSYLWAVGAFCLLPVIFDKANVRIASTVLGAVALAMLPISMDRLMTFSHPVLLWDDAEKLVKGRENLPGVSRIYYNRGTALLKIDFVDQAIPDLEQAVALSADFGEAYANLGHAYSIKGKWQDSVSAYGKAIEIFLKKKLPPQWRYFYGRAVAFEKVGEMQKSQADYRVTCLLASKGCEKLPGGGLRLGMVR